MNNDCRLCGKSAQFDGVFLVRVNPTGEEGIWECSPNCNHKWKSDEERIVTAIMQPAGETP